jgi:hypothetical protein
VDHQQTKNSLLKVNLLGYFPLLGIITGIFRLYVGIAGLRNEACRDSDNEEGNKERKVFSALQIARGIFEIVGLGAVLGVFGDLPVTICRFCSREKKSHPYFL